MKKMLAAAALSAFCLSSAQAQTASRPAPAASFSDGLARIERVAAPSLDELLDTLRRSTDRKEQLETLETITYRAGSLDTADQARLVDALQDLSSSGFTAPEIRGKCLDTLAKSAVWFKDPSAVKKAVLILTGVAGERAPSDMAAYKIYALMGLTRVADHLPFGDQDLEETVVTTALDAHEDRLTAQERLLALMVLQKYLGARGSSILYYKQELLRRVEAELVSPISGNAAAWAFQPENDRDYRYVMMRVLSAVAHSRVTQPDDVRYRIREIFIELSQIDRDGSLRELARLYARGIAG